MSPTKILLRLSMLLALAGTVTLSTGCPKDGTALSEDQLNDPVALFHNGVLILNSPDRRGAIDYSTAYERFVRSAELAADRGNARVSTRAHFNAAWVAEVLGRASDAERHYRAAHAADASYEPAVFSLARVLTDLGHHDEAVTLYRGFAEQRPDDLGVRNELMAALVRAGRYDDARQVAREILLADHENVGAYRNLAAMYQAKGNLGMSRLFSEKVLGLNEGDVDTYNNLGVTFLIQNDEPAAIEQFQTAIKLNPAHFEANLNLGSIALNSGDYGLALECFERAVRAQPASVEARLGLAVALRGTGEFDRADAVYEELMKAAPDMELIYFNAATLHEKYTRDFGAALRYLQAFKEHNAGQVGPNHPVHQREQRIAAAQAAEEARIAEERRRQQEQEERERRQREMLSELKGEATKLQSSLAQNTECLGELADELGFFAEQMQMVIDAEDLGMAADVLSMYNDMYKPMMEDTIAACAGGGGEPGVEGDEGAEGPEGENGEGEDGDGGEEEAAAE